MQFSIFENDNGLAGADGTECNCLTGRPVVGPDGVCRCVEDTLPVQTVGGVNPKPATSGGGSIFIIGGGQPAGEDLLFGLPKTAVYLVGAAAILYLFSVSGGK